MPFADCRMTNEKRHYFVKDCDKSAFDFICPTFWDGLKATDDDKIRFCTKCRRNVHLCLTDADLHTHAAEGHCVAVDRTKEQKAMLAQHWPPDQSKMYVGWLK